MADWGAIALFLWRPRTPDQEIVNRVAEQAAEPPFDAAAFVHRVGNDRALAAAMASLFLNECPRLLGDARRAVEACDAQRIDQAAHALKGSVSNFVAPAATAAAGRLEQLGRAGEVAAAPDALRALEAELDRLLPALGEMTA